RLCGGGAGLAGGRPALADRRAGARHLARPLADAHALAAAARRPDAGPLLAAYLRDDRRAVEPGAVPLALRARRPLPRPDHQLLGRDGGRSLLPVATPIAPIKACSLGGPTLGMAMDVVDDEGRSLVGTGEVGELVCRKPFAGMTRGFWRDPERYLETYWSRLPGVWVHGDWASVD